jgi:hypothetical protein
MKVEVESNDLDIFWEKSNSCEVCNGVVGAVLKVDKYNENLISFCLNCVQLIVTTGLIFHCQDGMDDRRNK